MTEQRKLIYDIVMQACNHPTAEEIFLEAKRIRPTIAIGTVYRNLGLLSESGEILHIPIIDGPDRYDKALSPHEHMTCLRCGCVVDAAISDLTEVLRTASGLDVHSYELNLKGICPDCSKEG